MQNRRPGRAPDYTQAALVMLGVNLMWVFLLLWAMFGFIASLALAALVNHAITRLDARLHG